MDDQAERTWRRTVSPVIAWLAAAELVVGVGALALIGTTNPLYYVLIVAVATVVVLVVAADERRRARSDAAVARRAAFAALAETPAADTARTVAMGQPPTFDPMAAPGASAGTQAVARHAAGGFGGASIDAAGAPVPDGANQAPTQAQPAAVAHPASQTALQSKSEEFVAALISYGMRVGVRTITRADREGWASALGVEYALLRAASCCAENDRQVVGELVTWDSVSVLHLLDTAPADGSGIARSVVAPYGRLPAATRVPVRRDPARVSCEVATLALDPRVANEYALHLLWRGIYDHARRGGATDVVWTLAVDLAALWRDHYGFPLSYLGDGKRAPSGTAVTIAISLTDLEQKLLRERPAYYGWMTVAFNDAERSALGLPVDLSAAYGRVCGHVMAQLDAVRSPLVLQ